jgi:peptidoglycan/LPS O-acetylase OafA/YrhL
MQTGSMALITGLRGFLALWVLFGHLLLNPLYDAGFASANAFGFAAIFFRFDFLAVDLFFVLSGALMCLRHGTPFLQTHIKSRQIDHFLLQRFLRLWPVHLAMMLLVWLYHETGVPHPISSGNEAVIFDHIGWTFLVNATLMHGWGLIPVASWNEPAWTISIMMLCYILFVNLMAPITKIGTSAMRSAGAVFGVLLLYSLARYWGSFHSYSDGAGAILRGVSLFVSGCFIARIHLLNRWQIAWHHLAKITALVMFCAIFIWAYIFPFHLIFFHLLYMPLILALLNADAQKIHFLGCHMMRYFGKIAYSLYMVHYPALLGTRYFLGDWLGANTTGNLLQDWWAYGLITAVVLALASLLYYAVERPCLAISKRFL